MAEQKSNTVEMFYVRASFSSMGTSESHSPAVTEDTHSEDSSHAILVTGQAESTATGQEQLPPSKSKAGALEVGGGSSGTINETDGKIEKVNSLTMLYQNYYL